MYPEEYIQLIGKHLALKAYLNCSDLNSLVLSYSFLVWTNSRSAVKVSLRYPKEKRTSKLEGKSLSDWEGTGHYRNV